MKRLRVAAAAASVVLAVSGAAWLWQTRDRQDPSLRFSFVAYGDCRHNDSVHRRLCLSMARTEPAFTISSGDLTDHGSDDSEWDAFLAITKELREKGPYYPVLGDHDPGGRLEKEFKLERPYYDKVIGDIHFFFLNSCAKFRDAEQLKWLEERAAASTSRHKIAVFHHPPFAMYGNKETDAQEVRRNVHGLLAKHKFCAAFCGHQHSFFTTVRDGVRYVVTAGGGAPLHKIDPALAIPGDLYRKAYHYVGCTIDGPRIACKVVGEYGDVIPELSFTLCEH